MKIAVLFLTVIVMFYGEVDGYVLKCFICNPEECGVEAKDCPGGVCGAYNVDMKGGAPTGRFCEFEESAIEMCKEIKSKSEKKGTEAFCYYCDESKCNKGPPKHYVFSYVTGALGRLGS